MCGMARPSNCWTEINIMSIAFALDQHAELHLDNAS